MGGANEKEVAGHGELLHVRALIENRVKGVIGIAHTVSPHAEVAVDVGASAAPCRARKKVRHHRQSKW